MSEDGEGERGERGFSSKQAGSYCRCKGGAAGADPMMMMLVYTDE